MTVDDDLDTLYGVRPEEFTALRKELVAASRKRGDAEAAKSVAAARRPTVAAWVVNHLVRADPSAQRRMSELSDALRAAHAEMDGARIRELTGANRRLVHELAEKAFAVADVGVVSAALRDDVTATLQAAIADAEVADRLGRLAKAEQWSGFGDFGASSAVVSSASRTVRTPSRGPRPKAVDAVGPSTAELETARRRRDDAANQVEVARAAHERARRSAAERETDVATARRRYEELLEKLNAAEQEVNAADGALDAARDEVRASTDRIEAATAELDRAQAALTELDGQ
jgi:DNA repair exonuclease SbcCD ATPase subunit